MGGLSGLEDGRVVKGEVVVQQDIGGEGWVEQLASGQR